MFAHPEYDSAGVLSEWVAAGSAPDAVAVVCGDVQLSYAVLDSRSDRLAALLRTAGVGADDLVAVAVPRSVELMVALLGVLKSGAGYLPVDAEAPPARIAGVLAQARVRVCLTGGGEPVWLPAGVRTFDLFDGELLDHAMSDIERGRPAGSVDVPRPQGQHVVSAYFTSGSTGVPKGVVNTQAGWSNRMRWMQREYRLGLADSVLHKTTLTFGDAALELFWPLGVGGRVVMLEPGLHRDPVAIVADLARYRSVYLQVVPSMLALVLDVLEEHGTQLLGSLRDVTSSGEALSPELVRRFRKLLPGVRLHNTWGATEVSIDSSHHLCTAADTHGSGAVSVGLPIDHNCLYVLDEQFRLRDVGVEGDLYIGGHCLARGYLHDPARTAVQFLPDPYRPGGRMYATGDRGSYRPDGSIDYAGRRDHQVKIRGMRVELGEIESQLLRHDSVRQAAVLLRQDVPERTDLVAYLVAEPGREPTAAEVVGLAEQQLPEHMVPRLVVFLNELPLNANGKLDRAALPVPDRGDPAVPYRAPGSDAERQVLAVFVDVLGISGLGVDDDFFAVGYSILAARAAARLRAVFGDFPLALLFEHRTAAGLAAVLADSGTAHLLPAGAAVGMPPAIAAADRSRPVPLSAGQEQLWFLHQLEPESPLYNEPVAYHLDGALDVAALAEAFGRLVGRHEALRTGFVLNGDRPVQHTLPARRFELPVLERFGVTDLDLVAELTARAREPFDLSRPGLLDVALYRLGDLSWVLFVNLHHIVTDGWSSRVFGVELAEHYAAARAGRPDELAAPRVQFADFADWQRRRLADGSLDEHLRFWQAELAGSPTVLGLPADRPRPAPLGNPGARAHFVLDPDLAARAARFARRNGASLYHVTLAAFTVLLHRCSGQYDAIVGTPMANRGDPRLDELIGYFVHTVPIRSRYDATHDFAAHLNRIRATVLAAAEHQATPFDELVRALRVPVGDRHPPLVQVVFAYQHDFDLSLRLPGLVSRAEPLDTGTARYELTMLLTESADGGIAGVVEYATGLFDADRIDRFTLLYRQLLERVLAEPERALADHTLLPARSLELLAAWNPVSPPVDGAMLDWNGAAPGPDAVAVVVGDDQLSYGVLDSRSDRLARHLRERGVRPDDVVAVAVPRSMELMVALVGVLKAGAGYLPVDPEAPPARIAQMLAGARVRICLTAGAGPDLGASWPAGVEVVDLDRDWPAIAGQDATCPAADGGQVVSVYYTSGSTGVPKGVVSTQAGWRNRMRWMQGEYRLNQVDSVLHKTTLTFDDAALELFWPLGVGARVVMLEPDLHRDPIAIVEHLARYRSVYLQVVPSMLALVLDVVEEQGRHLLGSLRDVTSSGEALSPALVRRFHSVLPGVRLHNTWGATEVSIDSTHQLCTVEDQAGAGAVAVGRPFDGNQVYVLDVGLSMLDIGVEGDLYIAGSGVARGYLHDPARTAAQFLPDPHQPGGRMYATGDRGYYRPDGTIKYTGRRDHQIKIRGMRVELGEIETHLHRHQAVADAAVTVQTTRAGVSRLVAFVAPTDPVRPPDPAELRSYLGELLPGYMVPSLVLVLDRLPLTPNGKVDRRALVVPADVREHTSAEFVQCDGPVEEALAAMWCELLGLRQVGALDDFFELGAHSLLASRLVARVRQRFGLALPLRTVFSRPTVRALAAELEDLQLRALEGLSEDELRALIDNG